MKEELAGGETQRGEEMERRCSVVTWSGPPVPPVEGVVPGDDVCAVMADQEVDALVEGACDQLGHQGGGALAPQPPRPQEFRPPPERVY